MIVALLRILAIRYQSGKLFITLTTDSGRRRLYELNDEIRNRWLDFKFQVRFSNQSDGEIEAFLNDKNIITYKADEYVLIDISQSSAVGA